MMENALHSELVASPTRQGINDAVRCLTAFAMQLMAPGKGLHVSKLVVILSAHQLEPVVLMKNLLILYPTPSPLKLTGIPFIS